MQPSEQLPNSTDPKKPQTPSESLTISEILLIWLLIVRDGLIVAFVFVLVVSFLTIISIMAGHLENSQIYVAALGVCCAYFGIGSSIAFGLNVAFNVITSRCNGINDKIALSNFLRKQCITMTFLCLAMLIFTILCYI